MIQAGIRVLPTSVTPITDNGNFALSTTERQTNNVDFSFTTRNTQDLLGGDLYIMKFNFDLRRTQK